jgi:hypothetical protein
MSKRRCTTTQDRPSSPPTLPGSVERRGHRREGSRLSPDDRSQGASNDKPARPHSSSGRGWATRLKSDPGSYCVNQVASDMFLCATTLPHHYIKSETSNAAPPLRGQTPKRVSILMRETGTHSARWQPAPILLSAQTLAKSGRQREARQIKKQGPCRAPTLRSASSPPATS